MTPEVRVDPLTGLRAIVASDRVERPGGALRFAAHDPIDPATDPFLPGHEDRTPPELLALPRDDGAGWGVRVFANKFPLLGPDAPEPPAEANPDLFTALPAVGAHEVIVNAPEPVSSLSDLSPTQLARALEGWRLRLRAHADAACRHLIVNERPEAGATLLHTHAQLYALDFVPALIARERERFGAYAVRTMGGNLLGDLVQDEVRRRERLVAVDDEAVLLTPYASRGAYHLLLAPRRPAARWEDDGPTGGALLAQALDRLGARFGACPPLNLWLRTAPQGAEQFCWRIEILPRLTNLAGLELGAGIDVCTVAPEQAAAELRDAA
jgi:UDPglucose--hexose-1-phosphate uridylyltransferase